MEITIIALVLGWLALVMRLVNNWIPLNWPYQDRDTPDLCRHCGGLLWWRPLDVQFCEGCECSFEAGAGAVIVAGEGCRSA